MDHALAFAVVTPLIAIFLCDVVITVKALTQRVNANSEKMFTAFSLSVTSFLFLSTLSYSISYGIVNIPRQEPLYLVMLLMFLALTTSCYYWLEYLVNGLQGKLYQSVVFKMAKWLPIVVSVVLCAVSPWTRSLYYFDEAYRPDGSLYYQFFNGNQYYLQALCPLSYVVIAHVVLWVEYKAGNSEYVSRLRRFFLAFVFPVLCGLLLQVLVFRGGYTQIGFGIGLLMMYLELYVKEVNDNKHYKDIASLTERVNDAKNQLEVKVKEISKLNGELSEAKEAAVKANMAKSSFLLSMSHEIRTPMSTIMGSADLIKFNIGDPEKVKGLLSKILASSTYMLGLTNNVLELARLESGKVTLNEEPMLVDFSEGEFKSMYEDMMKRKHITLTQTTQHTTQYVYADVLKLQEIIINLMSNAYKFTPDGGTISVENRELPCDRPGYTIMRTVIADTGVGITPDMLPHVFDEFVRDQTNDQKGAGLGLPLSKKLVELMGGTITIDSEPGVGTKVIVDIPHRIVDDVSVADKKKRTDSMVKFRNKHILLAEDNDLNAEITTEVLTELGFVVDRAADGQECVEMVDGQPAGTYDLVLMDIQMPRLNGNEATARIRQFDDPIKSRIPIVAMTANAFTEDKQAALASGMNAHLAKPLDIPKLLETLATLL